MCMGVGEYVMSVKLVGSSPQYFGIMRSEWGLSSANKPPAPYKVVG